MTIARITPVILTFNEEPNIGRTLSGLAWAGKVIVVDSGSTDQTLEICEKFPNVEVHGRPFDTHAQQWNYAISLSPTSWVLSLDADYQLSPSFVDALKTVDLDCQYAGYCARFRYLVFERPLRASILPPRCVLFDRNRCEYFDDGHTQRLQCNGERSMLEEWIDHDDRKSLERWTTAQVRYARLEVRKLMESKPGALSLSDRIRRKCWIAPWLVPVIALVRSGIILDGWRGWYYALQRGIAEAVLALLILEARIGRSRGP